MPRYTGINHLAMATGDMDATIRFWRDLLGMRLVVGLGHPGYRHYFFSITDHDMIAFFEWPGVEPLPEKDHGFPVKGPFGFDHVSFEVAGDDDLWEIKDRRSKPLTSGAPRWWTTDSSTPSTPLTPTTSPSSSAPRWRRWTCAPPPAMADTAPSREARKGPEPQPVRLARAGGTHARGRPGGVRGRGTGRGGDAAKAARLTRRFLLDKPGGMA